MDDGELTLMERYVQKFGGLRFDSSRAVSLIGFTRVDEIMAQAINSGTEITDATLAANYPELTPKAYPAGTPVD